jgi:hypothetical protein
MPTLSKFQANNRGSPQLLDSDGCRSTTLENTYLGGVSVDHEERIIPRFPSRFWNHFDVILSDPNFPRTSNMVEGFHRGFKTRVHRPKPSVQEYFRAIDQEQVMTDYHIDRLEGGKTPSKRRRMSNHKLFDICKSYPLLAPNWST